MKRPFTQNKKNSSEWDNFGSLLIHGNNQKIAFILLSIMSCYFLDISFISPVRIFKPFYSVGEFEHYYFKSFHPNLFSPHRRVTDQSQVYSYLCWNLSSHMTPVSSSMCLNNVGNSFRPSSWFPFYSTVKLRFISTSPEALKF